MGAREPNGNPLSIGDLSLGPLDLNYLELGETQSQSKEMLLP